MLQTHVDTRAYLQQDPDVPLLHLYKQDFSFPLFFLADWLDSA